jgi:hypothetical protein
MVVAEFIGFALVVILSAFLYYRHWQRISQEVEPRGEKDWNCKGFDTSGIAPQIESVRKNFLANKQPAETRFRRGLLAFARQAVSHLPFFEDRGQATEHGASGPSH